MSTLESKQLSIKEYHIMLTGYRERLLDTYEIASVQALFYRNAQSDKVKSLDDIYKRPENARMLEAREKEREQLTKKFTPMSLYSMISNGRYVKTERVVNSY